VRARLWEYRFTTREERTKTAAWWVREPRGDYFPAVSLDHPGFRTLLQRQGWLPNAPSP
jgi:hypothetical protein